jgi:hypothetical protein
MFGEEAVVSRKYEASTSRERGTRGNSYKF